MTASQWLDNDALRYGVMSSVESIPPGYSIETVVQLSSGVNQAMEEWGDALLQFYGKERYAYKRDFAIQKLGYSTDNGACA